MKNRRKLRIARDVQNNDRKHILSVVTLWICVAVLAVIIALAIGNSLGDTAKNLPDGSSISASVYKYSGEDVAPIDAWRISLSGQTPEGLQSAIESLPCEVKAISLYLRSGSGTPEYSSAVYSAVTGKASGGISLKNTVETLHKNGYYVSGCFDIGAPMIPGNEGCEALADFETTLICEALESGIDEIILLDLPSGQEKIAIASKIFESVRQKHPQSVLGAGIDYKIMLSNAGAEALLSYSEFADFCAVDTAGAKANGSSAVSVVQKLAYVFETYPIRLLFEFSSDSDRQTQADALHQLGIINIQSHKPSVIGAPAG